MPLIAEPAEMELQRSELQAVLQADLFRRSPALAHMLSYLCEKLFAGEAEQIKEYSIATEALGALDDHHRGLGDVDPDLDHGRPDEDVDCSFVHAIAHIEFNAIDLAWDAVYRFRGMPQQFYADWVGVAADEARHFKMLRERLQQLGHDYGDFDAHNGLWEMAEKTAHDGLARMALVPRVLEARGLDVPSLNHLVWQQWRAVQVETAERSRAHDACSAQRGAGFHEARTAEESSAPVSMSWPNDSHSSAAVLNRRSV